MAAIKAGFYYVTRCAQGSSGGEGNRLPMHRVCVCVFMQKGSSSFFCVCVSLSANRLIAIGWWCEMVVDVICRFVCLCFYSYLIATVRCVGCIVLWWLFNGSMVD